MNKIEKFLRKLPADQGVAVEALMRRLRSGDWLGLNVKKLQGYDDLFRVRSGRVRIIFEKTPASISIVYAGFRNDTTYNF